MTCAELAQRLDARPCGDGYVARCPVPGHGRGRGDRSPSLSISESAVNGALLWRCYAGCSQEAVALALGLNKSVKKAPSKIVATYDYRDATGELLYLKKRLEPGLNGGRKSFVFEHNGQKGRGGDAVLYNQSALVRADIVYVTEGEAKADLLHSWGLAATCLDAGAGSPFRPEYAELLAGKHIVILTDNDRPGKRYGEKIAAGMAGLASTIKIIALPGLPEKGDLMDWAREEGNTRERLHELFEKTTEWEKPEAGAGTYPCLQKIPLENILNVELPSPAMAVEQLFPEGELTLLGGHGGSGKTILALTLAAHFATRSPWFGFFPKGGSALFVSLEDPATLMKFRLKKIIKAYDLSAHLVEKNLTILDGSDSSGALMGETSDFGVKNLIRTPLFDELETAAKGFGLIIIDGASDTFGGDENSRRQVRTFMRELRGLAKKGKAGLILLAHIDKNAARYGAAGNSYSGSTAWHNSSRSRLALIEKDGGVELIQEKLNVGKKLSEPIKLAWHDGVLLASDEGQDDLAVDSDAFLVLAAVQKAINDGASVPTSRSGPSTTQNVLERFPDLPRHLRGKKGRDFFYRALSTLQREGTLTTEEYTTPARHIRERFICASLDARTYIPTPLRSELAKPAQVPALVDRVAPNTGTGETGETGAEEDLIL